MCRLSVPGGSIERLYHKPLCKRTREYKGDQCSVIKLGCLVGSHGGVPKVEGTRIGLYEAVIHTKLHCNCVAVAGAQLRVRRRMGETARAGNVTGVRAVSVAVTKYWIKAAYRRIGLTQFKKRHSPLSYQAGVWGGGSKSVGTQGDIVFTVRKQRVERELSG